MLISFAAAGVGGGILLVPDWRCVASDSAQDVIYMTVEQNAGETIGEVIHHVLGSGDVFQQDP